MSDKPVLYGFDGSTYVRTVRTVLAQKGIDYDQVPVNVLTGETREPAHLARHPFGKVPVMDIDGVRIRETEAICRYLDETRPEPAVVPADPKDRARMTEVINLVVSYGYAALAVAALHHIAPDFIGGKDEAAQQGRLEDGERFLKLVMEVKGGSPWIAGERPSLADYFLGPILFYTGLTPDAERLFAVPGLAAWRASLEALPHFKGTEPVLG